MSNLTSFSNVQVPSKRSGRGDCQRQENFIANDRTWTLAVEFPQNSLEFGEAEAKAQRDAAARTMLGRGLMTATSIIWSFWANGQITGAGRDYCYYTRPRTQSKPDYTSVSLSLPILTRSFDCQLFALVRLHGA